MRIGFCGAHRTGKTTLADATADYFGIPRVSSPSTGVAAAHGFNMDRDSRFSANGLTMQATILDNLEASASAMTSFVCDRTPLDNITYLMCDAIPGAGTPEQHEEALQQVGRAMKMTSELFDIVLLIPPAIPVVATPTSPAPNIAYQEHYHMVLRGLLFDNHLDVFWDELQRETLRLERRMDWVIGSVHEWLSDQPVPAAA